MCRAEICGYSPCYSLYEIKRLAGRGGTIWGHRIAIPQAQVRLGQAKRNLGPVLACSKGYHMEINRIESRIFHDRVL